MTKWNGRVSNIVISEHGSPELYDELNKISHKARGERLRCLATIGLMFINAPKINMSYEINSGKVPEQLKAENKAVTQLGKKIIDSL